MSDLDDAFFTFFLDFLLVGSLGVVLYVVFTGQMPFFEDRMRPALALQQLLRFYDIVGPEWQDVSITVRSGNETRGARVSGP